MVKVEMNIFPITSDALCPPVHKLGGGHSFLVRPSFLPTKPFMGTFFGVVLYNQSQGGFQNVLFHVPCKK